MAFVSLNSTEIAAGEPVKQELWDTVKEDLDDLNSRVISVENAQTNFRPIFFSVHGRMDEFTPPIEELMIERINFDCTIVAARLITQTAGSAGSNEIDIQLKRGANPWQSIFSTLPSVDFSAGDYAFSTNQVLSTTALLAGDILRLDITSVQTEGQSILVHIEIET